MRIVSKYRKFQDGGAMPPEGAPVEAPAEGAPAPEQGGDPLTQILQVAAMALQNQDCEAAMAVCQAFIELAQGGAQGGPAPTPEGEPTFARYGAKLVRVRR